MQAIGAHPISPEAIREIKEDGNIVNIVVRFFRWVDCSILYVYDVFTLFAQPHST
jgi:hypothetical protein